MRKGSYMICKLWHIFWRLLPHRHIYFKRNGYFIVSNNKCIKYGLAQKWEISKLNDPERW